MPDPGRWDEAAILGALRRWVEHDLDRAVSSVQAGIYPEAEARREFLALALIRADMAQIDPALATRLLSAMFDEAMADSSDA